MRRTYMRPFKFIFSRFFICIVTIAALTAAIVFLCLYIHSLLPVAAAFALSYLLSAASAISALCRNEPKEFLLSWLAVIILLPVLGAIFYALCFLSGSAPDDGPPQSISSFTRLEYFDDGKAFLQALTAAIDKANKTVFLEFYIIARGCVFDGIYEKLLFALARGVEVKIIYDGIGSALRAPKRQYRRLKRAGAEIKVFNKMVPAPLFRLNYRDHRKIAAIDGRLVFLGGVNIADEYAHETAPHGYWKDGGALFYGDIAAYFKGVFLHGFGARPSFERAAKNAGTGVTPVTDSPGCNGSSFAEGLLQKIYSAQGDILLFTPYLCTDDGLTSALISAAKRGVKVKIIIPGIPDKKLTYSITRTYCTLLKKGGVEVYEYAPGFMHFKGLVCDGSAFIGSYNADFRSLYINYECGVWAEGKLAESMRKDFEDTLLKCRPFSGSGRKMPVALARLFAPIV